jgi:zinc protease
MILGSASLAQQSAAPFKAPKPKEWSLSNGLEVRFLRDNELPLVYGTLYLRGGTVWQEADKLSSVAAMGALLREGGAGSLTPDQLNLRLDKLAAGVSSSFGQEWGKISFSCLSKDVDEVFSLFADVVLRPKFDPQKLAIWKGNAANNMRRRKENPGEVAQIAFQQIIYGDSPFGRVSTDKDVEKVTREAVLAQYKRFVQPKGGMITLGGNITEDKAKSLLDKAFSKWQGEADLAPVAEITQEPAPGIYFITLPVSQSSIYMGHLGVPRMTPDYPEIDVFNEIFGSSGFGLARLFVRIRTELGLAYSVYGGINPGLKRGANVILVQTKSQSSDEAVIESLKILSDMQINGVTQTELDEVKSSIENGYVFGFASTDRILSRHATIELLGWPDDYDQTYISKIRGVSAQDVQGVAQKRWNLGQFVFVVVGNEDAYAEVARRLKEDPQLLQGMPLKKIGFDQKIVW